MSPPASPSTPPAPPLQSLPLPPISTHSGHTHNASTTVSPSSSYLKADNTPHHSQTHTPNSISSCSTTADLENVRSAYVAERSDAEVINVADLVVTPRKLEDTMTPSSGVRGKVISPPLSPEKATALRQQQQAFTDSSGAPRTPLRTSPESVSKATTSKNALATRSTPPSYGQQDDIPALSPTRPPRPSVSPLDIDDTDQVEELQAHLLSALEISPAAPYGRGRSADLEPSNDLPPRMTAPSKKAIQDSFFQWSETASSADQSESVPPPPSTYASSLSQPTDPDRSFLRMTRTTIFSDFSAPSTVPDVPDPSTLPTPFKRPATNNGGTLLSVIPETRVVEEQEIVTSPVERERRQSSSGQLGRSPPIDAERRSSAGTFGPSHTRQSGTSRSGDIDRYPYRFNTNPFASPPRSDISNNRPGGRLRPLSMSSAGGESNHTGSAYSGRALDDTAIAARKAIGVYPAKGIHRNPEPEAAIEDYLKKQSEANMRRIAPSDTVPSRLGAAIELDGEWTTARRKERVLGAGAESSKILLGMGMRSQQTEVPSSTGLPPPLRAHKPSASVPAVTTPTSPTSRQQLPIDAHNRSHTVPYHPLHGRFVDALVSPTSPNHYFTGHPQSHGYGHSHSHLRSASIDSLPSLHPSLSESINTLSNLIPISPAKADPRVHAASSNHKALSPEVDIKARNDLTPEQRAILLRRTRKLEQMLGEAIPEAQIGKLVVDPHHHTSTFAPHSASIRDGGWPVTPSRHFSQRRAPGSRPDGNLGGSPEDDASPPLERERSKSSLADKARAALGFDRQGRRAEEDPYWNAASQTTPSPPDIFAPKRAVGSAPDTPATFTSTSTASGGWVDDDADESVRRNRRQQLAKLHRLLGAPIPPELLNPYIPSSPTPPTTSTNMARTAGLSASHSVDFAPVRAPSPSERSYITFDDAPSGNGHINASAKGSSGWKLKVPLNTSFRRKGSSTPAPGTNAQQPSSSAQVADDMSFIDMSPSESRFGFSKEEKSLLRRRGAKLEQVLGDRPPMEMYMTHSTTSSPAPSSLTGTPTSTNDISFSGSGNSTASSSPPTGQLLDNHDHLIEGDRSSGAFDAYNASLHRLLYLVENDENKLGQMMDDLTMQTNPDSDAGATGRSPRSPVLRSSSQRQQRDHTRTPPSPVIDSPRSPSIYDTFIDFTSASKSQSKMPATASSSPAGPSEVDEDEDENGTVDPQSHSARRRRTGKLSQFFGENVNLSISPDSHPPPRNLTAHSHSKSAAMSVSAGGAGDRLASKWRARRETLDGVLGEMWTNVQSEVGRGAMRGEEGEKLGLLMGLLKERERERRTRSRMWEMI
ncbi:hypothetical protein IAU59_002153 [Kwoniella sp. CBS 9459]